MTRTGASLMAGATRFASFEIALMPVDRPVRKNTAARHATPTPMGDGHFAMDRRMLVSRHRRQRIGVWDELNRIVAPASGPPATAHRLWA